MRTILALALAAAPLAAAPTFSEDVAPILFENCTSCHRAGQAGPFSLQSYDDAKKRGAFLAAVTASRYMPPWHATDADVAYEGDRRLTEEQIQTIQAWVDAGMPEGDPAKTPAIPAFAEGWLLGEPDLVAAMDKPFTVPADGPDVYEYFVVDVPADLALDVRDTRRELVLQL